MVQGVAIKGKCIVSSKGNFVYGTLDNPATATNPAQTLQYQEEIAFSCLLVPKVIPATGTSYQVTFYTLKPSCSKVRL